VRQKAAVVRPIRMKIFCVLMLAASCAGAQTPDSPGGVSTLSARTTLVMVPALVKTKAGEPVFTLTADRFEVTDDGVPQKITLDDENGSQPLALVVLIETGSGGARRLENYRNMAAMIDAIVGGVEHQVAVVGFDSEPQTAQEFTPDMDAVGSAIHNLAPGDRGGAILDGLGYAVDMLRKQPEGYRRAILLVSETVDHGSKLKLGDALREVSDTNTTIYSLGFSSSKDEAKRDAGGNLPHSSAETEPGPAGGCMAKGGGEDPNESRLKQAWDCAGVLLPPLKLAQAAAIAANNGLKKNVPETVSRLSGGEYYAFSNAKQVERSLAEMANHLPNRYVLTFHPAEPHAGFHTVGVRMKDDPELVVTARTGYWADAAAGTAP